MVLRMTQNVNMAARCLGHWRVWNRLLRELSSHRSFSDWTNSRKRAYSWVKGQTPFLTPCFKTGLHEYATEYATKLRELHSMMLEAWEPIFNRFKNNPSLSYEQFLRQFPTALAPGRTYTAAQPVDIPPIAADSLRDFVAFHQALTHGKSMNLSFWAHILSITLPCCIISLCPHQRGQPTFLKSLLPASRREPVIRHWIFALLL